MNGIWWFWIALGALLVGALLSTLQVSLRHLTRASAEEAAEGGSAGVTARMTRIANDPTGHSAAVALPRLLCQVLAAVASVKWVAYLRGETAAQWTDVMIGLFGAGAALWVLGVLIPTAISTHAGGVVVRGWSRAIRGMYLLLQPLRPAVVFLDEVVRRLAGEDVRNGEEGREELISVVEEKEREGAVDEAERHMIEAVVDFKSTTVEQIMTPRTDVQALEYTDDLSSVTLFMRQVGHSRIPVFEENLDHVRGILYAKDLLRWLSSEEASDPTNFELQSLLREPVFVPETKTVRVLLNELLSHRVHLAIVADEYGGTSGIVTIEDIVEEIFGEIHDEYEHQERLAPPVVLNEGDSSADVDARTAIDDANDELEPIGVEFPESEDYETVGGMVVTVLGRIPSEGESFRHNGFVVTVLEASPTRVERVRVQPAGEEHADDEALDAELAD